MGIIWRENKMQIIIVGCGKVGATLVEQLSQEERNDITVIDTNAEKVRHVTEEHDVMGFIGNGVSYELLLEAGVEKADLLIAVTGSDEKNLLCCLFAKKAGNCQTIARVRKPDYNQELYYIKEELGLAMIVNPELAAAMEIARVLRLPAAISVESFAKGRVEILKLKVKEDSILCNMAVSDISSTLGSNILVCVVERDGNALIPSGDFVIREKDVISIIGTAKETVKFFRKLNMLTNPVKNLMIVGGGNISYYLTKVMTATGVNVVVVENDPARCEQLTEMLPEATIVLGDGADESTLIEEGLEQMDSFAALTGIDEENILLSLYAKSKTDIKTITKINRINFSEVIENLDLDTMVYPKRITAEHIVRYARAMANSLGSNVETMHRIAGDKVEALEFIVHPNCMLVNRPLSEISFRDGVLVASIHRKGKIIIPRGNDTLQVGDTVVIVTTITGMTDLEGVLKKK
ncbi:MAG: Trk system potassium transporter TrkA [Eubacteriales bacterium]|nr:Trk system potassium transporter TrkA [Eubacteriales bacterium]